MSTISANTMDVVPYILSQARQIKSPVKSTYATNMLSAAEAKDPAIVGGMFEAMFHRMWLAQARSENEDDDLFGSSEVQQMREMQDEMYADQFGAQGVLGIVDFVEKHMQPQKLFNARGN